MIRKAIARSRLAASRLHLYCLALAICTCTAYLDASGEPVPTVGVDGFFRLSISDPFSLCS